MTRVACVGTGLVGSAWSVVFAKAGCEVAMFDAAGGAAEDRSRRLIGQTLRLLADTGELDRTPEAIQASIRYVGTLEEALDGVSHVQESAKEDPEVKRQLFETLGRLAPRDAVLASSTSAIKGSEFLTFETADRALVAHPVNPPSLIPLVELCGTPRTAPETIERTHAFMTALGMAPVVLRKEIDGFLLNRLQYTLVAEALHLVGEGYCSAADIDRVMTQGLALRWATIGPFEVAHLNSPHGFRGFVDHLGGMMRKMGADARTDYDWPDSLASDIHAELLSVVPEARFSERQAWRDANIAATRAMQRAAGDRFAESTLSKRRGNDDEPAV